jgi:hypothetical protein
MDCGAQAPSPAVLPRLIFLCASAVGFPPSDLNFGDFWQSWQSWQFQISVICVDQW